jgi:hypothetical protein
LTFKTSLFLCWRCTAEKIGNIAQMHFSSIWIHKVAVYDIMVISWGGQTIGLIVGGRVDKYSTRTSM